MRDFGYFENCNRKSHFLGQIAKETEFWSYNESFNYSKAGFDATFKKSSNNDKARAYARENASDPPVTFDNQVRMANILYSGKFNHTTPSNLANRNGDGYKFRGRGLIQLTGKPNYEGFQKWYNKLRVDKPIYELPEHNFLADVKQDISSASEEITNREGPNKLFDPKILVLSAIYYFEKFIPKELIDNEPTQESVDAVTNKINSGEEKEKREHRYDYVIAAKRIFQGNVTCGLKHIHRSIGKSWRYPIDNPMLCLYTQKGNYKPWHGSFGEKIRDGSRYHAGVDLLAEPGEPPKEGITLNGLFKANALTMELIGSSPIIQLKLELDSSTPIQREIFKEEKITDIILVLNLKAELPNYPF
jgi:predicted chitinase